MALLFVVEVLVVIQNNVLVLVVRSEYTSV